MSITDGQRSSGFAFSEGANWIREVEVEDGDGSTVRDEMVDKAFKRQMMEVFQGRHLDEIINEMFVHMRTSVENPPLTNSRFVFN